MKVVVLAGGLGSRLAEETQTRPKPMVEIGGRPMLWHIMKHYAHYGFNEFYVALGYKGDYIKRFFANYAALDGDLTVDVAGGEVTRHHPPGDEWKVHLVDTGQSTQTGGRLRRLRSHLETGTFMVTYGDGVADVDLSALLAFHQKMGRIATVTAVRPPARFGGLEFDGDLVSQFTEKPQIGEGWINGGYLVFEPKLFDYLDADESRLESNALTRLAEEGQLAAYRHETFWQCMDTLRDKRTLSALWETGEPPWRVWR